MTRLKPTRLPEPLNGSGKVHVAELAFNKVRPTLEGYTASSVTPLNIDVQAAAVIALGVARTLTEPVLHARIVAMAKIGTVDLVLIDELETVSWAAWYSRHRLLEAGAMHSGAAIPAAMVEQGFELRARMLRTLDYNLADDSQAVARLEYIRKGTGHLDLANDLSAVGEMYGEHQAELKDDRKNYRASDRKAALELSAQMVRQLGGSETPERDQWRNLSARAAKLLFTHYEEAIRVGRFLFHYDDPEGRFPNLYAATRAAAAPAPEERVEKAAEKPVEKAVDKPADKKPIAEPVK